LLVVTEAQRIRQEDKEGKRKNCFFIISEEKLVLIMLGGRGIVC
jgi:hypothetical protein